MVGNMRRCGTFGLRIQVHGHVQLLTDTLANLLRNLAAFRHGHTADRNERDDVHSAHTRVFAVMVRQIDACDCRPGHVECRLGDSLGLTCQRDDGPVVIGVGRQVQQFRSRSFDDACNGAHLVSIPAFADVGNTLYDLFHVTPPLTSKDCEYSALLVYGFHRAPQGNKATWSLQCCVHVSHQFSMKGLVLVTDKNPGDLPGGRDRLIRTQASLPPLGEMRVRIQASRRKMAVTVLSASIVMVALEGSTTSGVAPVQLTPIRSVLPLGFRHSPPSPFVQGEGCSRRRQESTSPSQAVNLPADPISKAPQASLVRLCPRGLDVGGERAPACCTRGLSTHLANCLQSSVSLFVISRLLR